MSFLKTVSWLVLSFSLFILFQNCGGFLAQQPLENSNSSRNLPVPLPDSEDVEPPFVERTFFVDRSNPELMKTAIAPDTLDPMADTWIEDHQAYLDTRVEPNGILVLYLMGAGGNTPMGVDRNLSKIASYGFHVIAPDYAQDYGIANECGEGDPECYGSKRLEAFEGVDHSPIINVSRANSIEQRLTLFLRNLEQTQSDKGWFHFLDENKNPRWDRIYLVGHSHGASTAVLIGKIRKVGRVVSFAGPADVLDGVPSTYLSMPSETPIEDFYAFSHQEDNQYERMLISWDNVGYMGDVFDIDGSSTPPFNNAHKLSGSFEAGNAHGIVAPQTPEVINDTQEALLEPVWQYLLGVD